MNIQTNEIIYIATRDPSGWNLKTPFCATDKKTKERKLKHRDTYHTTLGQVLAKISDLEFGKAKEIADISQMVADLRRDLLNSSTLKE